MQEKIIKQQSTLIELKQKVTDINVLLLEILVAIPLADINLRTQITTTGKQNVKLINVLEKYC